MKKIVLLIAFIIITASLFAADYCQGTVTNNCGGVEDAYVGMYFWTQEYGWLEIDYVRNNPETGYYSLCFEDEEYRGTIKVTAYLDRGVNISKYYDWNGGSIICNFVYVPGHQDWWFNWYIGAG